MGSSRERRPERTSGANDDPQRDEPAGGDRMQLLRMKVMRQRQSEAAEKPAVSSAADQAAELLAGMETLLGKLEPTPELASVDATLRSQEASAEKLIAAARKEAEDDAALARVDELAAELAELRTEREERYRAAAAEAAEAKEDATKEAAGEAGHSGDAAELAEGQEAEEAEEDGEEKEEKEDGAKTKYEGDGELGSDARGAFESAKATGTRTTDEGEGKSTTTSGSVEVKEGGLEATASHANSLQNDAGSASSTTSGKLGYDENGVSGSASYETEHSFSENNTEKTSAEVGFSSEGVTVGGKHSDEVKDEHGTATTNETSGSLDLGKQSATVGHSVSQSTKSGTTASVGVEGTVGAHELGGKATASLGTKTVAVTGSAGAKLECEMHEPVERDGKWVVTYTKSASASAGVGGKVGGEIAGSASIDASLGTSGSGERVFETEEEAAAFYARGEFGSTDLPSSADAALDALPPGASLDEGTSGSVGVGIGGGAGGVGASFGLQRAKEQNLHAERGEGDNIILTLSQSDMTTATAGLGSLLTMQYGESWGDAEWQRVEFDLGTESGKQAFESFTASRQLPPDGWTLLGDGKSELQSSGIDLSLLGAASGGVSAGTVESTGHDAAGGVVETSQGTESANAAILGMGSASEKNSLTISDSGGGRDITAETEVDSTSAEDASRQLASATGTHSNSVDGEAAGKWSVETDIPPALAEEFLAAVESGKIDEFDRGADIGDDRELFAELRTALAAAGPDKAKRRSALTSFVAKGGDAALAHIMTFKDGAELEHFVTLEGDDAFLGADGYAAVERRLDGCAAALHDKHADHTKLTVDLETVQQDATVRLQKLGNPQLYKELPNELRQEEIARTKATLSRAQELLDELSRAPVAPAPVAAGREAAQPGADTPSPSSGVALAQALMGEAKDRAHGARSRAQKAQAIHEEGEYTVVPKADLGDGILLAGPESATYHTIDTELALGAAAFVFAEQTEKKALTPGLAPAAREEQLEMAQDWYEQAEHHYSTALGEYDQIRRRHPEYGHLWDRQPVPMAEPEDPSM